MKKKFIWVSYDLGVQGDYEGMYAWLDNNGANECGDSVACFWFSYNGNLFDALKSEIRDSVTLDKRSRVYVVYTLEGKMKGRFIFGRRKAAPWEGYGTTDEHEEDEADGQTS